MPKKRTKKGNRWYDMIFIKYYNRLTEIAMSRFKWNNLPPSIDERYLENILFYKGFILFYYDNDMEDYLALQCTIGGELSVYNIPVNRVAFAPNGYRIEKSISDSVIIYNNYLHANEYMPTVDFADQLTTIDKTIRINVKAQKTPILLRGEEKQMTTLHNLYEGYEGDEPVLYGDKKSLGDNPLQAIPTLAPFVSDKLYILKSQIWNEAMTYYGIPNINENKKERLIKDEVERQNGGTIASRNSALEMRKIACEEINRMFGLDISVEFRDGTGEYSQLKIEDGGVDDGDNLS